MATGAAASAAGAGASAGAGAGSGAGAGAASAAAAGLTSFSALLLPAVLSADAPPKETALPAPALNMGEAPYTFRLDLGVRDTLGKFWFVDHKTTTRLRKDHGVIYGLSIQFQAYAIAGQAIMADRYGGVMANMIECGEDALKFERPRMPSIPGFLMGFAERIETIYRQMKALVDAGLPPSRWPKRPGFGTCRAYGKMCPFYDRCRLNA
jgi:hypothetical protein